MNKQNVLNSASQKRIDDIVNKHLKSVEAFYDDKPKVKTCQYLNCKVPVTVNKYCPEHSIIVRKNIKNRAWHDHEVKKKLNQELKELKQKEYDALGAINGHSNSSFDS